MEPERIRAILVDDEELARTVLRELLAAHADVDIVCECANGFEAVKMVSELAPDLVFLDVQMPKLNGFEVLELLDRDVAVIFTTAYDTYALQAFEVHAVDYLLKPFGDDRLAAALVEARRRIQGREKLPVAALAAAARPHGALERILIRDGTRVHILPTGNVDYVEAQDDYILFHAGGKQHIKLDTLSSLETQLDPQRFVRIHRSYLLNIERLARVEPYAKDSRIAILHDGTKLPVSRSGYARLSALL
ncbi:MAG TPA: LytTR family DNA-binding domain-containing protein [Candidatus Krumholzibacteria bacterium]|jgi:two-component system, LytTR family, response regulator|nr:LytTR family DNA-binding domain-containing protein [Candidatus Krumholzibacteria bacterium]